jgi:hypothetical protein
MDTYISPDSPVRLINRVVDRLDLTAVTERYAGGGCSCYSPQMLLKVLFYGYLNKEQYIDGTKMESQANRHAFVRKKSKLRNGKSKLRNDKSKLRNGKSKLRISTGNQFITSFDFFPGAVKKAS